MATYPPVNSNRPDGNRSMQTGSPQGEGPHVLHGVVERITFHNEENGYTVAKLVPERRTAYQQAYEREVAIVGNMMGINVGESVELLGRWMVHGQYGRQFSVTTMRTVLPATVAGIQKYLGSGLVKGIGPITAQRIVDQFGMDTLDVIDNEPGRLIEVAGVGRKRVQMIKTAWAEQRAIKEVMVFLQSHGVTTGLATKIYKHYGDDAVGVVQQDPYRLARDIFGIGFLTADKIAQSLGIAPDAPQRVAAGVAYALSQATDEGHVFMPAAELVRTAAELLEVPLAKVSVGVIHLWNQEQIKLADSAGQPEIHPAELGAMQRTTDDIPQIIAESGTLYASATQTQAQLVLAENKAIYLTPLFYSEVGIANRLMRLCSEGESILAGRVGSLARSDGEWHELFHTLEQRSGFRYADQQRLAIQTALTHRLSILTGGPGTGKTTTVRTVLELCQQVGAPVLLAAPTGRAAKRLSETTGAEAKTIHRLLEFQPTEGMAFKRNEDSPLEGAMLIVDEASMLDQVLTNHLLKAVSPGMHLLLVGDVDQLPSVGAGNVLKDLIAAIEKPSQGAMKLANARVVRLETIFRQETGSFIITNAHRINQGQMPTIDNEQALDFFLFRTEDPQRAAELCVEIVQERVPRRFAIPPEDIQLLSPMHRGVVGVAALNEALQSALNPVRANVPERRIGSRSYRKGDRVMQIRNNYDKDVYNGDMGRIVAVDLELQNLTVNYDGRQVVYDFLELDELVHAYAISVHKSQGSEFPAVVIPVLTSHYMMLQRNLLYTAVTRAKRLVVLVGQPKAIGIAVRNNKVAHRHTGLQERLGLF